MGSTLKNWFSSLLLLGSIALLIPVPRSGENDAAELLPYALIPFSMFILARYLEKPTTRFGSIRLILEGLIFAILVALYHFALGMY